MKVIQYLKEFGLDSLCEKFAIKTCVHEDGRVILNYWKCSENITKNTS